jgi:outer membrane biosynthesis protein TonB
MDGVLLVFDSRNLPNLHALAPVSGPSPRTQKRNRTVPAFATLILALVLGLVYYVSTQRPVATLSPASITSTALPEANSAPPAQPAEVSLPPAEETRSPEKPEPTPRVAKTATVSPTKKSITKTSSTPQTKAPPEEKKDDSKVGTILKKTGRILKKPFKL